MMSSLDPSPSPPPLTPQDNTNNSYKSPRKIITKKSSKRFQIIPKTTSSGSRSSDSGSSSFDDPLKGAGGGSGGINFLPDLAEASFPMKSIIYELKEVSIRIISLLKIEETLSLYEKQRLQKLISNFQSSIQSNLFYCFQNHRQHQSSGGSSSSSGGGMGSKDQEDHTGGKECDQGQQKYSTKESLILIHYVLGLILFLQLPSAQIINPDIDRIIQKILKRGFLQQEDQQIFLLRKVLELFPEELFLKTFQFLSQPLVADLKSSSQQTRQQLLRTQSSLPSQDLPPTARSSIQSSDLQSQHTGSSSSNLLSLLTSSLKSSKSYTMLTSLFRQSSRIHSTSDDPPSID
jgi:hypothetical protein